MSGRIPIGRALGLVIVVTAAGWSIMTWTTPTDQQFYDSLAPDLKKKVDENRRLKMLMAEKQRQLQVLKESAESEKPVWADSPPPVPPKKV